MLNLSQLYFFAITSLSILIVPGPAVLYITLQSIQQGRVAGIVAVLGLELGTILHVTAAALGISRLSSSVIAFNLLKGLGIAYLLYLGVDKLRQSRTTQLKGQSRYESFRQIFWRGIWVEVFNPKTALFFFAFLPQFVSLTEGNVALQVIVLGLLFLGVAIVIDLLYALLASSVRRSILNNRWFRRKQHYFESTIYIALGLLTALLS